MKPTDTISVLICVHSRDHAHDMLFQRALESLARQTYDDFETVIIFDECHEDTKGIAESYKDVLNLKLFERPHKQGLAVAKNFGLKRCSSDWIAYLDADDMWADDKLEKQIEFAIANPEYDIIATQAWDVYEPGTDQEEIKENCFKLGQHMTDEQIKARLPYENCICHGSVLLRKSMLDSLGGYNTGQACKGQEDYCLWKLAASKGYRFFNIAERLYFYSMGTSVER